MSTETGVVLGITRDEALLLMPGGLSALRRHKFALYQESKAWQSYLEGFSRRFWSKVDRRGNDECWAWRAGCSDGGYGQIMFAPLKVMLGAHRVSHVMSAGIAVWAHETCHQCDNPPCVNPAHLVQGTHLSNVRDCMAKGRFRHVAHLGSANGRSILTEADVRIVKGRLAAGHGQKAIADYFNVRPAVIWRIAHGRTWGHGVLEEGEAV